MAYELIQVCYKYPRDVDITPGFTTETNLISTFTKNAPVVQLGIQADPGTKVKINGVEVIVGPSGIYELINILKITSIMFPTQELFRGVIVDMIYDKGE